ncbi:transglycosylase domain-containing protein [Clostridium brassicae]|uniref:Penicillin-binding protein 1A n=1 Tax=Clostridium brassicae TaxID=2999072 RepID=A0ABT4DCL3_9CLOT|nr:transglycosylase domain-containing protein [Clostridium brassicae]MCY6960054.1 transglycosylase domain-containing protein [Clostridium brassicae]
MKKVAKFILLGIFIFLLANNSLFKSDNGKYSIKENLKNKISSNTPNYVEIDKIPQDLKNAIISTEDKRFFRHYGFDIVGIGRAFITNIRKGEIKQGGSTITQQLAKNLFLSDEKSYVRKFKELVLAIKLEAKYTKEEILEMYLNVIYYGEGAYGIENASLKFFNKHVWELSLEECAMLAGLPQAPSKYNPNKNFYRAKKRQEVVLKTMYKNGFINKKTMEKLKNKTATFANHIYVAY